MATTRDGNNVRTRIVFSVEGKSFEASVTTLDFGREVTIVEKVGKKTFTGKVSILGGRWIGKLMCQISSIRTHIGTSFRLPERWGSIIDTVLNNEWGKFLKITIYRRDGGRRFSTVCFPSGENGSSWEKLGAGMRTMLEFPEPNLGSTQAWNHARTFTNGVSPSFAQMCNQSLNGGRNIQEPCEVNIRNGGVVTNAFWWRLVVICKVEGFAPDWKWLEDKPSSSTSNQSRVRESPLQIEDVDTQTHQPRETNNFSINEIARGLSECRTSADISHWIKYMVVPFSHDMGMTSELGVQGEERMFWEIYNQYGNMNENETINDDNEERALVKTSEFPKELLVSNVV
ncbi:hypothetical protein FRX31_025710 [Thalictrum thalictroides]|uniref:Uncharacterized protein n=1 Tax=Thalictrum thalictroides TaxID=46969 RepID=A0A7J6VKM5_THATH|nr:hypothetical protein FRX31_025710 [Thalictrum thalictroides]